MDDEKLISLVRDRNVLYNKYHPSFRLVDKKVEAWMDIANEMETSAEECAKRWSCLRDRFTREWKKMEDCIDNESKFIWSHFESMEFIKPFVTKRPTRDPRRGNLRKMLMNARHSYNPKRTSPVATHSAPSSPSVSPAASPVGYRQKFEDPLNETLLLHKESANFNPDVDKSFCEAVETLKRTCALSEAKHANPAVHAFGEMIVSTICRMSSRNQLRAMQQVTDTVMRIKLEEDELLEELSYPKL